MADIMIMIGKGKHDPKMGDMSEPEGIDAAPEEMMPSPAFAKSAEPGREGEVVQEAKARNEAFLKRLQKLYGLDRDQAVSMMEELGGLDSVIKKYQMREEKDLKAEIEKNRPLAEKIKKGEFESDFDSAEPKKGPIEFPE